MSDWNELNIAINYQEIVAFAGVQIRRRLRESNAIDTKTFCAQFNERN